MIIKEHLTLDMLRLNSLQNWQYSPSGGNLMNGYTRTGINSAPRLHFLHGTGFSSKTLAPLSALLPEEWELWFSDVPGHGGSEQPNHRMPNWQKLANTIADTLYVKAEVENKGPLIGVGHSMGGVVTLLAAAKYPKLFSKIILLDPVLFKTEIIIAQHLMRTTGAWKKSALVRSVSNRRSVWPDIDTMIDELKSKPLYCKWHPEVLTQFVHDATKSNDDGSIELCCDPRWEGSIFGSYPAGLWRAVRNIDTPVEILAAEKSYGFIKTAAKKAAKINNNISWQIFGKRHCFPMEQPLEAAQKIKQLISDG
ncbi:alpha/beta hydrolase [Thalassotalea atypica]|uniref:alpha/beta hydrolase n=1 Tax=Thalassotalea atypica TaxID=2054316 RepID=UPI002573B7ED|nr:alpha/beta hydrolase [Thalassotalea atypica]